jgi:hypothetical protein
MDRSRIGTKPLSRDVGHPPVEFSVSRLSRLKGFLIFGRHWWVSGETMKDLDLEWRLFYFGVERQSDVVELITGSDLCIRAIEHLIPQIRHNGLMGREFITAPR